MPAAARDLAITYGGFSVGSGTTRPLTGRIRADVSWDRIAIEFEFVIREDRPDTFTASCLSAENSFRTPYQDLIITGGDALGTQGIWYTLSQAAASGLDAQPSIRKAGSEMDSSWSRKYSARVEMGLPANLLGSTSGRMGRRQSSVSVFYSPSRRRRIEIRGTYTGVPSGGSSAARTQYEAVIDAYASAVQTSIDAAAKWELAEEPATEVEDSVDTSAGKGKVLRFSRVYDEVIFEQAGSTGGTLDNPDITRQFFRVSQRTANPGSIPNASLFTYIDVTYDAWIAKAQVNSLIPFWRNTIKPWILQKVATLLPGANALIEERPTYDFDDSRISAAMTFQGTTTAGDLIEGHIDVEDSLESGVVLVPVFAENEFAAYKYQGPGIRRRTIQTSFKRLQIRPGTGIDRSDLSGHTSGAVMNVTRRTSPIQMGLPERRFTAFETVESVTIQYFAPIQGTSVPSRGEIPGEEVSSVPRFGGP